MTEHDTRWITRQDAAIRAGVALRTIDRWRAEGRLTTYKVRGLYVRLSEVEVSQMIDPETEGQ